MAIWVDGAAAATTCVVATRPWARFMGIRSAPAACGVMFTGRSAHGFGVRVPLLVIGVDVAGVVVDSKLLVGGGIVSIKRATTIVELPFTADPLLLGVEPGDRLLVGRVP